MSEKKKKNDEVGYCKPPRHSRFKKGQSGNPKGRPKGAKGFTASLERELATKIKVREGNREVEISKAEAATKRLVAKALGGDMAAMKMLAGFDADLKARIDAETEEFEAGATPDQTDAKVLEHFATLVRGGQCSPDVGGPDDADEDEEGDS